MGLTGKEYHLKFTRKNGHYKINAVRVDSQAYKAPGLLHRVDRLRGRLEGDVPKLSLTRKINSLNPQTTFGKSAKVTLKALNGTRKLASGAAWKTALGAETAATSMGAVAVNHFRQELRQNADTLDTGKAVLSGATTLRTINGARKTIVMHRLKKNQYKLLKSELPGLKDAKNNAKKLYKAQKKSYKPTKRAYKAKLKAVHKNFGKKTDGAKKFKPGNRLKLAKGKKLKKTQVNRLKVSGKSFKLKNLNVKRKGVIRNHHRIRKNIRVQKGALKKLKRTDRKIKNLAKKQYKNKKKLKRLSKPKSLARSAAGGVMGGALNKATTKISQDAADNDFVKAGQKVNNLHRQVKAHKKRVQGRKLNRTQKKASSKKLNQRQNKLNHRRTKLQRQSQMKKHKKRKPKPKKKAAAKAKELAGEALKFIGKFFAALAAPLLIILFVFVIILSIFGGVSSNNTAVAGTYYCSDYDIAQVIEEYTNNAYEMNENVIKTTSSSDWKSGLEYFDVDTSDMKDTPTIYEFGESDIYGYSPVYDYDPSKLIAFMCAYEYDNTKSTDEKQTWNYDENKHDSILQDLLDTEYEFECTYKNGSYWQEKSSYKVYPDTARSEEGFYYCESCGEKSVSGTTYGYISFGSYYSNVSSLISKYCKDKTLYFDLSTGEVKNASDDSYDKTGYYLQDMVATGGVNNGLKSASGTECESFYNTRLLDNGTYYLAFSKDGTKHKISNVSVGSNSFNWVASSNDVNINFGKSAYALRIYKKEEYITDCTLYTNVKQKCTFDKAIEEVLKQASTDSDGNLDNEDYQARVSYYYTISCQTPDENGNVLNTYGLHQGFTNSPLKANFEDVTILHGFGYEVQWGSTHCDNTMHYGNDYTANKGDSVYSMIDGKITEIGDHTVVIHTTEDHDFWYDNDSAHEVEISYENIKTSTSLKVDDEVSAGEKIGEVDDYRHCDGGASGTDEIYLHVGVKVKYDMFGWGWHDVDPSFLIYPQNPTKEE